MNPNELFIQKAEKMIREDLMEEANYILYVDISNFHAVNYFYGQKAGDTLLKELEAFLNSSSVMRLCTNIFADYFLCLCSLKTGISIGKVMESYDFKVNGFLQKQQAEFPACKLKIACGVCPVEKDHVASAVDGANMARKLSKEQFATAAVLYSQELREEAAEQYKAEQEIYDALQNGRFCFYLQPKVDLTSGKIVGAEALARRKDKNGEVVYPDTFLGVMEKNGSVIELDRLVCRQVCMFLAERIQKGLPVVCISVNLSRLHIQNPDTADRFHSIAAQYRIPPELLEFELTETILLEEFTGAKKLIDQLRAYGYRVSIDDFGSGYAGINIWQELNFDCLKLDRKFLSGENDLKSRNEAIVPNIIDIAQRLDSEVLCEGVETVEQCRYLLRLGCTIVQGFFFSRPVPPEQFFHTYGILNGHYPLPANLQTGSTDGLKKTSVAERHFPFRKVFSHVRSYLFVIAFCAVFLGICITAILSVNRNMTHREFTRMVTETLNAYTSGQRGNTLKEINSVTGTLQSLQVLIRQNDDPEFLDAYLLALNEDSQEVKYMYLPYDYFKQSVEKGTAREEDVEILDRLMKGETVVTDIMYSERMGDIYCIAVGLPVFQNGTFIGALRGVINAETLVNTELYDPAQGKIAAAFLTDSSGKILTVRKGEESRGGENLLAFLKESGIDARKLRELRLHFLSHESKADSVRLGEFDGSPYYLSIADLEYNDWHLVVILQADAASTHLHSIIRNTTHSIWGLIAAVLFTSLVLIQCIGRMQHKFSIGERRYLLLEQFSDTVLFDYDCIHDIIRFTSNAGRLLRIHENEQKYFLSNLNQRYIYAGDRDTVRKILTGQEEKEVFRVRLLRPEKDEYFWSMIKCRFLFEKGKLSSVIGKITDIDEHMRHEDYLLRMSETDGLTGLRNKQSAEKQIGLELTRAKNGLLFLIDLDNFKQINDQFGHAAGDMALRYMGETLRRVFRSGDVLGRAGGDEFVVFVLNVNSREAAVNKAELLEKHLASGTESGTVFFTASIGIACYPQDGETYEDLYRAADQAMYAAKQSGKSRFCFSGDHSLS